MKTKIKAILLALTLTVSSVPFSGITTNAVDLSDSYTQEVDWSLWERFLKYDLCITDYDSLTDEEKELCKFIFETERSADDAVICERARRIIAGYDVGERITLEQLEGAYGIWDNYSVYKHGWQTYIHCVPDIVHLDDLQNNHVRNEYWLDDSGSTYVMFNEKEEINDIKSFDVYNSDGDIIHNIPAAEFDSPYKDFRCDAEYMSKFGFIEKNGGYYYVKPDDTAVFAWSIHSASGSNEPLTDPFIVESEINGCPVTAIENRAFSNSPFTEIILPDSIKVIDEYAFAQCTYLQKVNFPEGLEYLGVMSFVNCSLLSEVTIDCPELKIQWNAFSNCDALKSANLNVKEIGESAFASCYELESVTFGDNITRICTNAFKNCKQLSDIEIPEKISTIGQGAFQGSNIRTITVLPTADIIGAVPMNKPTEYLGIGVVETHPLTDEPVCVFDSDCVINGWYNTEAHRYAVEWGLKFNPIDEGVAYGDINLDGGISVADAVLLQKYLTGSGENIGFEADLSKDGIIDIFDIIFIKSKLTEK